MPPVAVPAGRRRQLSAPGRPAGRVVIRSVSRLAARLSVRLAGEVMHVLVDRDRAVADASDDRGDD
jgi:hypothetical protein